MNHAEYKRMAIEQEELIKRVFGTPDGKRLLRVLSGEYLYSPILSNEEPVVYRRLGKQDLILLFVNTIWKNGEVHERGSE
jgi:hypothetical protein